MTITYSDWPDGVVGVEFGLTPLRKGGSSDTPISGVEDWQISPYQKYELNINYKPSRAGDNGYSAVQAFGVLSSGQAIRSKVKIPGLIATVTGTIQATGSNSTLNLTKIGGGSARAAINGGSGFRKGQLFSMVHNGINYLYSVAQDQTDETLVLNSRLRGGAISSPVNLDINFPYIVGMPNGELGLSVDEAKMYGYNIKLREFR